MLSLTRSAVKRAPRELVRSFSEAVNVETQVQRPPPAATKAGPSHGRTRVAKSAPKLSNTKVPVPEDHGLYAFFRKTPAKDADGKEIYEVVESPDQGQLRTGRAWEAAELRNKSFKDLHTLWYVVLRERNLLASQKEEARRLGVTNATLQVPSQKVRDCRKTMSRIKAVLNERRLAYEGAVQLAQEEAERMKNTTTEQEEINEDTTTEQEEINQKGRYDGGDHQVLLIQSPNSAAKSSKAKPSKIRADSSPAPDQPANPWTAYRAYGNYRTSQIEQPAFMKKASAKKVPGRRRGVPKPRPIKN